MWLGVHTPPMKPICMPTQLEMGDMEEMHTPTWLGLGLGWA